MELDPAKKKKRAEEKAETQRRIRVMQKLLKEEKVAAEEKEDEVEETPEQGGRGKKNVRNPEYSGFRLFGRIEWVPPLKIKKLLRVMRRTGKQP